MPKPKGNTDTPSSSASTGSQELPSQRSAIGEVVAQLTGLGISLFAAQKASILLACTGEDVTGPLGIPRWLWGLFALVLIAVPTSAYQARKLAIAILSLRLRSGK